MPILFACQKIQKAPAGSRRIIAVGAFFEVLYIPPEAPEPEAPEAPAKAKAWPLRSEHPPSGDYAYICERVNPDGSLSYPQEGLTIPGLVIACSKDCIQASAPVAITGRGRSWSGRHRGLGTWRS